MDQFWTSVYKDSLKNGFVDDDARKLANSITRFRAHSRWLHDDRLKVRRTEYLVVPQAPLKYKPVAVPALQ
jgi:hypothetical protein